MLSDHSGYTQLPTRETNVPCDVEDTESSGQHDQGADTEYKNMTNDMVRK